MPRGRKNRRKGNGSNGNNSSGSQQPSAEPTEPSGEETENPTTVTDVEIAGSSGADVSATPVLENRDSDGQVENSAASLASDIEALISDYGRRLQLLSDHKGHLLQTSQNLRAEFDERLDKLQQELTDRVHQNVREQRNQIQAKMEQCLSMKSEMEAARASTEAALASDDPVQVITSYQRGIEAVKQSKNVIEEMKQSHETVRITHEFDVNSEDFMSDGLTLGTIKVTRTKEGFPELPIDSDPSEV
ncbi:uncharacterized protein LOC117336448 [Pecten maximus]|uniref:uncharacterized protein LOC117336448 n=1 Tax=Pecten maximus TaxID=6579 RepID=UPI0014581332|nr:uncharacterized protein LOC117336448 [Pecten maximus]